jgi:hypothetical protein
VVKLNRVHFETSYEKIIQRLMKRISEYFSGDVSLYILEKYKGVTKRSYSVRSSRGPVGR